MGVRHLWQKRVARNGGIALINQFWVLQGIPWRVGLVCLFAGFALGCQDDKTIQPNILLIITDDLNDAIGVMRGHPQSQTPYLDKLARQGFLFSRAYANAPLCAPSRASFLSGILPNTSGYYGAKLEPGKGRNHWKNNPTLAHSKTIMEHFAANGYAVYGTGKIFHNDQEDYSVWPTGHFGVKPSWGPWPWDGRKKGMEWGGATSHPGYSNGMGIDGNFASLDQVPNVPPNPGTGAPGHYGWRLFGKAFRYHGPNNRDMMPDEQSAHWVKQKLATIKDRPFLMMVGLNRPHVPMYAPKKYFDQFPLNTIELAMRLPGDADDTPFSPDSDPSLMGGKAGFRKYNKALEIDGEQMLMRWTQAYLANVAFVDDMVGQILGALEKSRHANNTLVVFTSDHGYHMGEKEYLHKNALWEESCRVPFLVAGLGVPAGKSSGVPISLVDLFPTLIDFAGIPAEPNGKAGKSLDGHSLKAIIDGQGWHGNPYAMSVVGTDKPRLPHEPADPADINFSIRTKNFRYTRYHNGQEELYDHQVDTLEHNNQAHNPKYARALKKMKKLMALEVNR